MKKSIIHKVIALLILTTTFYACKTDKLKLFEEEPNVYFTNLQDERSGARIGDTVRVPFFLLDGSLTEDTVKLSITVTGAPTDRPRSVALDYDREFTDAIAGEHFALPETVIIPAGEVTGTVNVIVKKAASLSDTNAPGYKPERRLTVKLMPSNDFGTALQAQLDKNGGTNSRSIISYNVFMSNIIVQPRYWGRGGATSGTNYLAYFGEYSLKKFLFICDVNKCPPGFLNGNIEWNGVTASSAGTGPYSTMQQSLARLTQVRLNQMAAAGDTVWEDPVENRILMEMGTSGKP